MHTYKSIIYIKTKNNKYSKLTAFHFTMTFYYLIFFLRFFMSGLSVRGGNTISCCDVPCVFITACWIMLDWWPEIGHGNIYTTTADKCYQVWLWRRKWQLIPVFSPGESHGLQACRATVHGVARSQTWLSNWICMHASLDLLLCWFKKY